MAKQQTETLPITIDVNEKVYADFVMACESGLLKDLGCDDDMSHIAICSSLNTDIAGMPNLNHATTLQRVVHHFMVETLLNIQRMKYK